MTTRSVLRTHSYLIVSVAAALLSAALMSYRLSDALGGYHAFNEGFYLLNALDDLKRSMLDPVLAPTDPNNPWVYPWVLVSVLRVFGTSIAAARAVSVAATAAIVVLTYVVGRLLYTEKIGMLAAVMTAFAPGLVLVGRNIQIDALMLALMMATTAAYLQALRTKDTRWGAAAGVLAGVGMMTKLPFALLLVALFVWRTWATRGVAWIKERTSLVALVALAATALPWYLWRLLNPTFRAAQSGLAGSLEVPGLAELVRPTFTEMFWVLSPVLFAVTLLGLYHAVRKRTPADLLVLSVLGVHVAFFVFYHFHTYYYIPLVPFAALAAGRGLTAAGVRTPARLALAVALLVVSLSASSVYLLSGKKYSMIQTEVAFDDVRQLGLDPNVTQVQVGERVWGSLGPPMAANMVLAGMPEATPSGPQPTRESRPTLLIDDVGRTEPYLTDVARLVGVARNPIVLGYVIMHPKTTNEHYFEWNAPVIDRPESGPLFGWAEQPTQLSDTAIYVVEPSQ